MTRRRGEFSTAQKVVFGIVLLAVVAVLLSTVASGVLGEAESTILGIMGDTVSKVTSAIGVPSP